MTDVLVAEQPPLSEIERVTNTFVAPSKTFLDIFRSKSWWLPFILMAVVGYVFSGVVMKKIGIDQIVDHSFQQRAESSGQQLTQEQMDKARPMATTITKISFFSYPLLSLGWIALVALLLWLGFNFILGGESKYTQMFTMSVYAYLPSVIKTLLMIATVAFGNTDNFDIQDPVGTNLGFYLGADSAHWLKSLLGSFDIFTLWTIALMAIGGAILAKVKVKSGMLLLFGVWLLCVLIKTVVAAI